MPFKSFLSFAGFVLLIAAVFCPLLRPFHIRNFNLAELNKPYSMVLLLMGVVGIAGIVLRQKALVRLAAWLSLGLVVVLYAAVILRVYHSFSFIPFKSLAGFLARQVAFKWGWVVLFGGPLLALIGVLWSKKANSRPR